MKQHLTAPVLRSRRHGEAASQKIRSFRRSRLEPLEARRVLAAPTLGDLPSEITIVSGAPFHLALDGFDADGDALTYSTTTSDSLLTATIPKQDAAGGNRSLRITVEHHLGTDTPGDPSDDEIVPFGTMEFELFEGRAPRATSQIIDLAKAGWYNGKLFHRVISNFMNQGGSKNGNGQAGSGVTFDDQFDPTLQHTSKGVLSMAKTSDDTNDSQFFITNTATRSLDFNHTIFGFLTSGDDVREAIAAVLTDGRPIVVEGVNLGGNDRPLNDVVIRSIEVFNDHEDAVMMLAVPEGNVGDASVTVTVSDGNGGTAQKTINVKVKQDTENNIPYLEDIEPIWVDFDTPHTFQLDAVDVEGNPIDYFGWASPATNQLDVVVSSDGNVTITPKNDQFGAYTVFFEVRPPASFDPEPTDQDSQLVSVFVKPPAPTIALTPLSDTGKADDVTAINNDTHSLEFKVSGVAFDGTVSLEVDGASVAANEVSRTLADAGLQTYDVVMRLGPGKLADGVYEYQALQTVSLIGANAGTDLISELSGLLPVTIDTTDPVITSDPELFVDVGEEYRYQVEASDGDNTDIRYVVQVPYPGMQVDAVTGLITWTPDASYAGIQPMVVFAIDGAGNSAETARQEFDILVNASLEISIEGSREAAEETTLSFQVKAWDKDDANAAVEISIHETTLPAGATFSLTKLDDNTARFDWAIDEDQGPGEYQVTFRATDGLGTIKQETYTITATEVNISPELRVAHQGWTPGELLSIDENEALVLAVAATDADLPVNDLIFSLGGDVPEGASIDPETGEFTWVASELQGGLDLDMIVRVTDSGGLSDEVTVNISVEEVNSPPVFDPVEAQTTFEGLDIEVDVTARDPDVPTNTIRYSLVEGEYPEGAAVDSATGKVTWEVPEGFLEDHDSGEPVKITVKAEEVVPAGEESLSALTTVEVTVADSLEGLLAGVALMNAAQGNSFPSAPVGSSTLAEFDGASSDGSSATPSDETLDLGSSGSSMFDPLFGDGGSSGGENGEKAEDESEEKDESDEEKDSGEEQGDTSEGADIRLPGEGVSGDFSDAAIEEYLESEASTAERGGEADPAAETSADGEQIAAEDEALRVYVEELVAAVAENETAGI